MKSTLTVAFIILKSAWQAVSLRSALSALFLTPLIGPVPFAIHYRVPNYPVGFFARSVTNGEPDTNDGWYLRHREQFRELADPVVL